MNIIIIWCCSLNYTLYGTVTYHAGVIIMRRTALLVDPASTVACHLYDSSYAALSVLPIYLVYSQVFSFGQLAGAVFIQGRRLFESGVYC